MSTSSIKSMIKEIKLAYNELEKEYTPNQVEILKIATLTVIADKIDDVAFKLNNLGE